MFGKEKDHRGRFPENIVFNKHTHAILSISLLLSDLSFSYYWSLTIFLIYQIKFNCLFIDLVFFFVFILKAFICWFIHFSCIVASIKANCSSPPPPPLAHIKTIKLSVEAIKSNIDRIRTTVRLHNAIRILHLSTRAFYKMCTKVQCQDEYKPRKGIYIFFKC